MNEARFVEHALRNFVNSEILARLPALGLNDCWLVSGGLFQSVWNVLTHRDIAHGIKDYDVFYFDPDTSWDAEDAVITRGVALFADLGVDVEIRNQARVHLWYAEKFGVAYPPLRSSCEGIDRFLARACMVGLHPGANGLQLYAPFGLDDVETMTLRPNYAANFSAELYTAKAARWKAMWPELTVLEA
ncbi:MAG: nucleotidyltransferase family protein [Parvibaculum sp.]|uniref:nucleotidyltransferase family protein n=1 Tax=Parvibaculum sp. TaxID=2024848 RepID=UPI0025EF6FFE|nr:nucleotidyltransferase family protein [Parvibaculum sp.]MCE9649977.1 nucleotidyltransferase family protein [Parvibaculum sp.]